MRGMHKTFISAIATGIALGFLLILWAFSTGGRLSQKGAFDSIYVGMTREDEVKVLNRHHVQCGHTEPAEQGNSCTFSDVWIFYTIAVNPRTNTVARKLKGTHPFMLFKRP
jgi:hypothetical protein